MSIVRMSDEEKLLDAVERVRRGESEAIRFACYNCDEAEAAHRIVPPDVPLWTPHYCWGSCVCILGLA